MLVLVQVLLKVVRPVTISEASHHGESLDLPHVVGRAISVDPWLDHATDHGDLIGVVSRPGGLEGERDSVERRSLLVQVVDAYLHILWTVDCYLMPRPGGLEFGGLWILEGHPTRAFDLPLEDQILEHTLI